MASALENQFLNFMASKGRKVTEQMVRIVTAALGHSRPFFHDDVLVELQGKVSRATVFRTLANMVESGVLRQVTFNGSEAFVVAADED